MTLNINTHFRAVINTYFDLVVLHSSILSDLVFMDLISNLTYFGGRPERVKINKCKMVRVAGIKYNHVPPVAAIHAIR